MTIAPLNNTAYRAFGLKVMSEIPLPELSKGKCENEVDINIKVENLSHLWSELAQENSSYIAKENFCLFKVPDVAIFLIEDGNCIKFSPYKDYNEDQIRLYLLGTCMGAILMQRKILPLHGSAIAIDGKAYAIVGDSGAGKSTLASALLKRGFQLISDDVIPVTLNEENIPIVTPAYPQQKLWIESLNEFGMESTQYRPIINRETKYAIPVLHQFASVPLPLAGLFELVKTESDQVELNPIQSLQQLQTLYYHTYRNFFIAPAGLMEWHFNTTAKICEHIDLYQLSRPISRFTAHELTNSILKTLKKEEKVYG